MQSDPTVIIVSDRLFVIAKDGYQKSSQGPVFQQQNDAMVAIVFSALALEAFINELLVIAKWEKQFGFSYKGLDMKSTNKKFRLVSTDLKDPFDESSSPYEDFTDLCELRNSLVHLKPKDMMEPDKNKKYEELIQRLESKEILQNYTMFKDNLTLKVSTAKAAKWACETTSKMVIAILDKLEKTATSSFTKDHEQLAWYRAAFQPPT